VLQSALWHMCCESSITRYMHRSQIAEKLVRIQLATNFQRHVTAIY
jgi:hypothetical protein